MTGKLEIKMFKFWKISAVFTVPLFFVLVAGCECIPPGEAPKREIVPVVKEEASSPDKAVNAMVSFFMIGTQRYGKIFPVTRRDFTAEDATDNRLANRVLYDLLREGCICGTAAPGAVRYVLGSRFFITELKDGGRKKIWEMRLYPENKPDEILWNCAIRFKRVPAK